MSASSRDTRRRSVPLGKHRTGTVPQTEGQLMQRCCKQKISQAVCTLSCTLQDVQICRQIPLINDHHVILSCQNWKTILGEDRSKSNASTLVLKICWK